MAVALLTVIHVYLSLSHDMTWCDQGLIKSGSMQVVQHGQSLGVRALLKCWRNAARPRKEVQTIWWWCFGGLHGSHSRITFATRLNRVSMGRRGAVQTGSALTAFCTWLQAKLASWLGILVGSSSHADALCLAGVKGDLHTRIRQAFPVSRYQAWIPAAS
ncbi:hypothetical protein BJ170DRAFT_613415 [Xylariales sp. AK1849]|nr:hypothetical protein BJ170DRAFT_613415 [Xylariales sp. AK1849]